MCFPEFCELLYRMKDIYGGGCGTSNQKVETESLSLEPSSLQVDGVSTKQK